MKIEFKKRTSLDGIVYWTEVNNQMVIGSTKSNKDEAYDLFLRVVSLEGEVNKIETLETINK